MPTTISPAWRVRALGSSTELTNVTTVASERGEPVVGRRAVEQGLAEPQRQQDDGRVAKQPADGGDEDEVVGVTDGGFEPPGQAAAFEVVRQPDARQARSE